MFSVKYYMQGRKYWGVCGVWHPPIIENLHFVGQNPSKILSNFEHYKIVIKKLLFKFLFFSKWFCRRKCYICCPTFPPPPWAHTTSCLRYAWAAVGTISFVMRKNYIFLKFSRQSGRVGSLICSESQNFNLNLRQGKV